MDAAFAVLAGERLTPLRKKLEILQETSLTSEAGNAKGNCAIS
jgi:hypothetical protein